MVKKYAKKISGAFGNSRKPEAQAKGSKRAQQSAPDSGGAGDSAERLAPKQAAIRIAASVPSRVPADQTLYLHCSITNLGTERLASVPPNPTHLSYKWFDCRSSAQLGGEGHRTALVAPLMPGKTAENPVNVQTPLEPGRYILRITLVQEHVAWLDSIAASNACDLPVEVAPTEARQR